MAKSSEISRRKFIASAVAASSGLALVHWVAPHSIRSEEHIGGLLSNEGTFIIRIEDYEELKEDGGFKILKEITIGDVTDSIIIVRKTEKKFLVYSSVCRHKKCNVRYKKDRDVFVCPCHGSTYNIAGKVIKGPSEKDIPAYKVVIKENKLEISIQ